MLDKLIDRKYADVGTEKGYIVYEKQLITPDNLSLCSSRTSIGVWKTDRRLLSGCGPRVELRCGE